MIKFDVLNRWTGDVQFTAEIECDENEAHSVKLGLAVRRGIASGAYLSDADLRGADLRGANLRGANLSGANLSDADLRDANLSGAYLSDAYLSDAYLSDIEKARMSIVPQEGSFVGWKKAGEHIVKLLIPAESRRSNATGRKCRAEFVEVLDVDGADVAVTSQHGPRTEYRKGTTVHADKWDDDRWSECSHGIHFWLTREEAEDW